MTELPGGAPGEREFDAAARRLSGAGAVNTSDELLDDGAHGLRFFREFLPLLADWAGQGPEFDCDVRERYDELRGIDFAAFREDARRLGAVHRALLAEGDSMSVEFRAASRTWRGEAAEAAAARVADCTGAGSAVLDEIEAFGGAIAPVIDGIEGAVREYARFVLDFAAELECAGKTPDGVSAEIRKARGDLRVADLASVDDVFSGASSGHARAAKDFIAGDGRLPAVAGAQEACDEIRRVLAEDSVRWLETAFQPELQAKLRQFEQQSSSAQECVQQAFERLLSAVEISEDPFGARAADHAVDSAGGRQQVGARPAGTAPQSAGSSPGAGAAGGVDGSAAGSGEPRARPAAAAGSFVDGPAVAPGAPSDGPAAGPVASPDAPASTTPQSTGSDSMSEAGGIVQRTFADLSEQLFGGFAPEQDLPAQEHSVPFGGPPPHSGAVGLATADQAGTGGPRGATGLASMSGPDAAQRQHSAGSSAETGPGTMGAGMLGMATTGGDQQGDQERPAGDRRAEAWFDVADPGTAPVLGEDRE